MPRAPDAPIVSSTPGDTSVSLVCPGAPSESAELVGVSDGMSDDHTSIESLQPPDPINSNRKFLDFICKFMHLIDDSREEKRGGLV